MNSLETRLANIELARKLFEERERITCSELARGLNLSEFYTQEIIGDLEQGGIIREGEQTMSKGWYRRLDRSFELVRDYCLTLGVIIEGGKMHCEYGTSLHYQVTDVVGNVLAQEVEDGGSSMEVEKLYGLVRGMKKKCRALKKVVIAFSGVVSNGVIIAADDSHLKSFVGIDLKMEIGKRFGLACEVLSVMDMAVLGYYDVNKSESLAYVGFTGTASVAGGILVNGQVVEGVKGFAGAVQYAGGAAQKDESGRWASRAEKKKWAVQVVGSVALVMNPAEVILCGEAFKEEGLLGEVEKGCVAMLPAEMMPKLVLRDDWPFDVWRGLFVLARGIKILSKGEQEIVRQVNERIAEQEEFERVMREGWKESQDAKMKAVQAKWKVKGAENQEAKASYERERAEARAAAHEAHLQVLKERRERRAARKAARVKAYQEQIEENRAVRAAKRAAKLEAYQEELVKRAAVRAAARAARLEAHKAEVAARQEARRVAQQKRLDQKKACDAMIKAMREEARLKKREKKEARRKASAEAYKKQLALWAEQRKVAEIARKKAKKEREVEKARRRKEKAAALKKAQKERAAVKLAREQMLAKSGKDFEKARAKYVAQRDALREKRKQEAAEKSQRWAAQRAKAAVAAEERAKKRAANKRQRAIWAEERAARQKAWKERKAKWAQIRKEKAAARVALEKRKVERAQRHKERMARLAEYQKGVEQRKIERAKRREEEAAAIMKRIEERKARAEARRIAEETAREKHFEQRRAERAARRAKEEAEHKKLVEMHRAEREKRWQEREAARLASRKRK